MPETNLIRTDDPPMGRDANGARVMLAPVDDRSLARKLAEVMGEVGRVPKRGRNEFHRYDYATEADIVDAVRSGLAERRVAVLPNCESLTFREVATKDGKTQPIASIMMAFQFVDGDSGESLTVRVPGEGQDGGDKAVYKAMTGALKYALLKTFLIPTGDDPEDDGGAPPSHRRRAAPEAGPPPTVAAPAATPVPAQEKHRQANDLPKPVAEPPAAGPFDGLADAQPGSTAPRLVTEKQRRLLFARAATRIKAVGGEASHLGDDLLLSLGVESSADIPADRVDDALQFIAAWTPDVGAEG